MSNKILIVEDESIVAADIQDCLENLGYGVCGKASSGEQAMQLTAELNPDMVMMDIKLKGEMDGIEAASKLRKKNIPVIYLTAHADERTLERAKITEPYGYVLKPFEEIELKIALELAFHKYREMSKADSEPQPVTSVTADDRAEILSLLANVVPFSELPEEGLVKFAQYCHVKKFSSGELIAFEGDEQVDGFLVLSGRVALLKTSANGRELIVELLPPGDIFGLISSLDSGSYAFTARAQSQSTLLCVPRSVFVMLVDEHPKLYRGFLVSVAARLKLSHDISRSLAHDRVEVRVASALAALMPRFSLPSDSSVMNEIPITRQELADLTGTTVETAIRVTKAMERNGVLDLTESGVIKIVEYDSVSEIATS